MATNLQIDDALLTKAQAMGKHRSKRETVNEALQEYIQHREQKKIARLFGKIDYYPDYDPKKGRRKR